ncbi:MAG: hypothetical protein WBI40_02700 [Methylococcaceae bacterium]
MGSKTVKHVHNAAKNGDSMSKEIFKGSIASAVVYSGSKVMSIAVKNPVVVFGLGLVSGFLIHKYRKDIIASTTKVVDAGKDFVLQQKENLEDLVAETKES